MAYSLNSVISYLQAKEAQAYKANLERKEIIEEMYDEMIARYGAGGTFGAGYKAELETAKKSAISSATQTDISRGLYGVSPYEATWEKEVGAPARLKLEDIKMEKLTAAEQAKAGFLERIEEPYPDYGLIASLAAQAVQTPTTTGLGMPTSRLQTWEQQFSPTSTTPSYYGSSGYTGSAYGGVTPTSLHYSNVTPTATTYGYSTSGASAPVKTNEEYSTYLSNLAKTQGTGVVSATPSEYSIIQKRLQDLYGNTKATKKSSTKTPTVAYGYSPYGAGGF